MFKRNRVRAVTRLLWWCALFVCNQVAQATVGLPGTLDASWATGSSLGSGKAFTSMGPLNDQATAALLQPDGKIVIAGYCNESGLSGDFCALRYNANGTLDSTFYAGGGTPGVVVTAFSDRKNLAFGAVLQPDGKIVLAGNCLLDGRFNFCALRINGDGTIDISFNALATPGFVITSIASGGQTIASYATSVVLQPDGKLVLAGYCGGGDSDFCAVRYHANGALDTAFGADGAVVTTIGSGNDYATASLLQPDGKIVLTGYCSTGANSANKFCALRYTANGALDTTFNAGGSTPGKVLTLIGPSPNAGSSDHSNAVRLQPDGRIVLVGACSGGSANPVFCALRYNANGTLDTSFNAAGATPGTVLTAFSSLRDDYATGALLQPDGKIVLTGHCVFGADSYFCALRYRADGTLDITFGAGSSVPGTVATDIGSGSDLATAALLLPDGKIIVAGECRNGQDGFCAVRYDGGDSFGNSVCIPDIDGDGKLTATIDGLINLRLMLGLTNSAAVAGITFPANASRKTWPLIHDYLVQRCGSDICIPDLDGDGLISAAVDGLINLRVLLGFTGDTVTGGIAFPPAATRKTWSLVRGHLVSQCGMPLVL